jgi:hypothetical protein
MSRHSMSSAGSKNCPCVFEIALCIGTRHYCRFGNARLEITKCLFRRGTSSYSLAGEFACRWSCQLEQLVMQAGIFSVALP